MHKDICGCFRRNPDGSWLCVSDCTFNGPGGRIQVARGSAFAPGTIFMGFDLPKWLDKLCGTAKRWA